MCKRQLYSFSLLITAMALLAIPKDVHSQDGITTTSFHASSFTVNLSDLMLQRPKHVHFENDMSCLGKSSQYVHRIRDDAFFCALERRIEGKSLLPLRMRLGHLDYVNELERKNQREAYTFYHIEKHLRK